MAGNIKERIESAIKDIEKVQVMFRQKYGEECLADKEIAEALDIARAEYEELEQYRTIGTVSECREAVEKQKPRKPKDIEYDLSFFQCSKCGQAIYSENETTEHKYCLNCGQAIDWSDTE